MGATAHEMSVHIALQPFTKLKSGLGCEMPCGLEAIWSSHQYAFENNRSDSEITRKNDKPMVFNNKY